MTCTAIKDYFDALSIPSPFGRYGPYKYDGDQLVFNKWILQNQSSCISIDSLFGCLYAGYTGSDWRDGNFVIKNPGFITIQDGKFVGPEKEIISIIHAPGSSKQCLEAIYPLEEKMKTKIGLPIVGPSITVEEMAPGETMPEDAERIKFGAVIVVYNEESTIAYAIKSIYKHVDSILIMTSDYTWAGEQQPLDQTVNIINAFPDPERKIKLVKGRWDRDDYARNDALDILQQENYHYALIVDGDELWDGKELLKLKLLASSSPDKDVFRCSWYTYWKDIYHRIDPPENFRPIVIVKPDRIRFNWIREVCFIENLEKSNRSLQDPNRIGYDHERLLDCGQKIMFHHLSWSRPDTEAKAKIEKSPHRNEFITGWFENVWLKWNEDSTIENLHPTYPAQFKRAIEIKETETPTIIQSFDIHYTMSPENRIIGVEFIPQNIVKSDKETSKDDPIDIKQQSLMELKKHGKVLRETVINYFTDKFKECRYLEIGSQRRDCYLKINAWIKHDCEPNPIGTTPHFKGTSNEFFDMLDKIKLNSVYNVIFVDGLHKCEQALLDTINASKHVSPDGWTIVHDCLPKTFVSQLREFTDENKNCWNGDVYKAIAFLVKHAPDQVFTLTGTDQGCCVIKGRLPDLPKFTKEELCDGFTWRQYTQEKESMLHCVSWEEFIKLDNL